MKDNMEVFAEVDAMLLCTVDMLIGDTFIHKVFVILIVVNNP